MRNYIIGLKFLLLTALLSLGVPSPVWAESNKSVNELSSSVLKALTLATIIIYARDSNKDRDRIIQGIDVLDKKIDDFVYPASVYQVISDEGARDKIQLKNKSMLFDSLSRSAQVIYKFSKQCFSQSKLVDRKIIGSVIENKKQKLVSFIVQFGGCSPARVELSEVINIDGAYYFGGIYAVKDSSEGIQSTTNESKNIDFQYELAGLFKSGVAPAKKNGRWGLLDTDGKWLVSPKYLDMGRMEEGLLPVSQEPDKFAFMDASGKLLTDFKYNKVHYFSEGLAGVKMGEKWGFIDKSGDLKIKANYDSIRSFKKGFAPVKVNKKWGYINKYGKWLVKPIYNAAYSFTDDGFAVVAVRNKRGFINLKGRFIIKPSYRRVQRFSEGVAPVSKVKGSWFFINKENKPLFSKQFVEVRIFSEEITAVMNSEMQWGYLNKSGKLLIPFQFDKAYDFKEGLALVKKGNKRGYIDKQGNIVIPLIYDDAFRFSEGLAPVKKD